MYSANYHRASSVADAVKLVKSGDGKFLSGGMTLIPTMKPRLAAPSDLVDLTHIAGAEGHHGLAARPSPSARRPPIPRSRPTRSS